MKFEDALKQIKGAESVGGQLIVNRGGRNVLVGRDLQGNLIVEDNEEAKGIAGEVDDKAFEEGREAAEEADDRSPLSTHPIEATNRSTDPVPYLRDDLQPQPGHVDNAAEAKERQDALQPPKGSDPNAPKPNTEQPAQQHHQKADDKVEAKDKTSADDKSEGKDKTNHKK